MRSFHSIAGPEGTDSDHDAIILYEKRCRNGELSLVQLWKNFESPNSPSTLLILAKLDLERRFALGERPRAAEYFEKFPVLTETSDQVVSLVYQEFCLLQECQENPDSAEFCQVYAPWRDSLQSQLAYHRELSRAVGAKLPAVKFPTPGELFDKYRLHSILGRGGVARVYLATEDDLGGRRLAIKISASFGQEPSILAKLDHRNIVPILTVANSVSGLSGICMPYRPGVTLEELISRLGRGTPPRSARAIWDLLRPSDQSEVLPADELRTGWTEFPIKRTFSEAVAWIGLALTDAMSYLHGQGVFHRDVKPANVLLAYREGPQLLDFNLAQDPTAVEHVNAVLKGGTLPYMAPEQLKAFLDPSGWERVGPAADLYSLGLVLKELVTGRAPDVAPPESSIPRGIAMLLQWRARPQTPIHELNPAVPPTFASIIDKCLSVDPLDRYPDASALGKDLQLFLRRRPLEYAPNPSKLERAINWFHRNYRGLMVGVSFSLILSLLLVVAPTPIGSRTRRNEPLLDSGRREDLIRARGDLERLHEENPDSAWPSLYLSLVLEKLGRKSAERANILMQEACQKPDAEQALTARLEKDPDSPDLLTNLGIVLNQKGEFVRAKEVLIKSSQLDEISYVTLATLAQVEQRVNDHGHAVMHFARALEFGAKKMEPIQVYRIHLAMLALYVRLAERSIDIGPAERKLATDYLGCLKTTIKAFEEDWESMKSRPRKEDHGAMVALFEGCHASAEGDLAAQLPDRNQAIKLFEDAQSRFASATLLLTSSGRDGGELLSQIQGHDRKLRLRIKKYELR